MGQIQRSAEHISSFFLVLFLIQWRIQGLERGFASKSGGWKSLIGIQGQSSGRS